MTVARGPAERSRPRDSRAAAAHAPFPFADEVRAVLFDAGNTLVWIDHARIAALVSGAGLPCDAELARDAEMRARPLLDPHLRVAARREGGEAVRRYAELIVDAVHGAARAAAARATAAAPPSEPAHAPRRRAVEALADAWLTLWTRAPADAAPVLDSLAARGLRVGCVSNSDGRVAARLAAAGLASRLACIVDSGLVGVEKPDPRIFRRAADLLSVPPAACVYVGDFLALDVEGARAAGMHGVLLDPAGAWTAVPAGVPVVRSLTEVAARLPARNPSDGPRARP